MARSTLEDQGEGQDLYRRQKCNNGVPISTRYETSTITTTYVTYSYHTPPPRSTDLSPETSRPPPSSRTYYTLHTLRPPGPQITIRPSTSTTRLPPKKSVVSTTSDIIPKARAIQGVPVTITRTVVTRIPAETIYSCPLPSREPITSRAPPTSRDGFPTSRSSREPPTSREPATSFSRDPPTTWVEPTSRSNRPTSLRTNTTESTEHPSTRHESTTSSREPWYPSSAPSTPTSRDRPTSPPSTSPSSTRHTSTIIPSTSSAPNSTITQTPWPPITTTPHSYSECVYTLFDGTVPYGNYTAPCTSSTMSESLCTSFHTNGEWDLVPCTSTHPNTTSMSSTLTNTTTSTRTITSWPCSSYVPSWETWVPVPCTSSINVTSTAWPCSSYATSLERWVSAPCTSTTPDVTVSPIVRCSSFVGSRSGWVAVPCTSTPNITSTLPTITMTPTVITTPTLTHNGFCSTYVEDLSTWLPVPCSTITTIPTVTTITITPNITDTPTITGAPITQTPTITRRPTASHSQHCSIYVSELEIWASVPCTTARPTRSMCLNDDEDMWIPCRSVTRTSDMDTFSQTITETLDTSPIFVTVSRTPSTHTSYTRMHTPPQTLFPTITSIETEQSTLTGETTQAPQTETHTPTRTQTTRPSSAASFGTSNEFTPTSQASIGSSQEARPSSTRETRSASTREIGHSSTREEAHSSTREMVTAGGTTDVGSIQPTPAPTTTRVAQSPLPSIIFTSNFVVPSNVGIPLPAPSSTTTTTTDNIHGGALAGIVIGSILGVIGLLGLGAFIIKSFGGHGGRDLYASRGEYQATSGGGSFGGRDSGEGGGGGSGGMSEARNEGPPRSALRNRNMADGVGEWRDASWIQSDAYTGAAAAAAVAATAANNQRGRYADGGIRDEEIPDAIPQRYADGGLTGPDSRYDTGISNHPYGNQDLHYIVSNSEVQFDPYHDLAVRQDSIPVGGNIARQSTFSAPEVPLGPPGLTQSYHSTPVNVTGGYPVSTLQPVQIDNSAFISPAAGLSTTSVGDPPLQPQAPGNSYQSSPPYAYAGIGSVTYQSPELTAPTDIQRPPYWESSAPAASVDSPPQHGNAPRYSALTDVSGTVGIGGSPAPAYNHTPGISNMPAMGSTPGTGGAPGMGSAPVPTPDVGNMTGVGGSPQVLSLVNPTWNQVGVTEFGQNVIGSPSAQAHATSGITGSAAPDAPRGLHQGLTRLSTEVASAEGRDIDASSLRSASRGSVRPPRVGGPRMRPPRNSLGPAISPTSPTSRPDSRRSLPPAYEE